MAKTKPPKQTTCGQSPTPNMQSQDISAPALYKQATCLAEELGELLVQKQLTFCTAESCTGGLISSVCTDVSGASRWLNGGIVAYSNSVKQSLLQVPEELIVTHGAVSESVVRAMAEGACATLASHCSISVSGIAGPTGGTQEKPVGTVWIAVKTPNQTVALHHLFSGNRTEVRLQTVVQALEMLIRLIKT